MNPQDLTKELFQQNDSKIVFIIADGLGGSPDADRGSELEEAATPNFDILAKEGTTGLLWPVAPGITCGSGPGHLALFGYDPIENLIGRGVLSALGIGFELKPQDVAARGNFCKVDPQGKIIDRRAGRLSTERGKELINKLQEIKLADIEIHLDVVKEYRFLLVLRGQNLGPNISDTDPQMMNVVPNEARALDDDAKQTASYVNDFIKQARRLLAGNEDGNMILLRGFDSLPHLPQMNELYGIKSCAIAGYPMYRGISKLLGMHVLDCESSLESQLAALKSAWNAYDFFFFHYKPTDKAGEDGDYQEKVKAIERLDKIIPQIRELNPSVLVVTGDHSSPSQLKAHSWHPVPVLLHSASCRRDDVNRFGETACAHGGLGQMHMKWLMTLSLAHAGRLKKFGA